MTYMAVYKCRLCEVVFRVDTKTPADVAFNACIRWQNQTCQALVPDNQPHVCNAEEYIGLADFVGFCPQEKS